MGFLDSVIKDSGNEFASRVSDGVCDNSIVFFGFLCVCVFVLFLFFFKLLKHHTQHNTKGSPSQKKTTVEVGLTTPVLSLNLRKENDRGFLVLLYWGLYGSGVGACLGTEFLRLAETRGEVFRKLN